MGGADKLGSDEGQTMKSSKECPACHLINPISASTCDCGHKFATSISEAPLADPSQDGSVRWAWLLTIIWSGLTFVVAAFGPVIGAASFSPEQSMGQFLSAAIMIPIALAVRRGSRVGGWLLVAYMVVELVVRVSARAWLLGPAILFVLAIRAAIHLQKHGSSARDHQAWPRVLIELAFLQGALTATMVLWSMWLEPVTLHQALGTKINLWYGLDVAILWGLALAAFARQAWAGYALAIYQLANVHLAIVNYGWDATNILPIAIAIIYAVGAVYQHRAYGPMRVYGWALVGATVILVVANSARLSRSSPFDRTTKEFGEQLVLIPGLKEQLAGKDQATVEAIVRKTAAGGLRRLSDPQLVERAKLLGELLALMETHDCAEQLRGGQSKVEPALRRLDQATRRAWFELVLAGTVAEAKGSPAQQAPPTEEAIASAVAAVVSSLPSEQAERFQRIQAAADDDSAKPFALTADVDACWFLRTLVGAMPRLDKNHQTTLARLLISE